MESQKITKLKEYRNENTMGDRNENRQHRGLTNMEDGGKNCNQMWWGNYDLQIQKYHKMNLELIRSTFDLWTIGYW